MSRPVDPRAAFAAFHQAFDLARTRAGKTVERDFRIGGHLVRMRFAGVGLVAPLTAPFSHLAVPGEGEPDLVIGVWDSSSTATELPVGAGDLEEHHQSAMPGSLASDGIFRSYSRPDPGLSMLDLAASQALYWLPDATQVPYEDRSAPFRGILNWWMSHHGRQFVHGAAVGTDRGAVLLVGRGGSGKSTTALSSLIRGMLYVGDDYCLLSMDGAPRAHSLYSTAKLHGRNLARLPELREFVINADRLGSEKGVLLLNERFSEQIVERLPLVAVVVPEVARVAIPELKACSRAGALAALAPSTLLQLSSARPQALRTMADLIRSLPPFSLSLSTDLAANADTLRDLIDRLPSPNTSRIAETA